MADEIPVTVGNRTLDAMMVIAAGGISASAPSYTADSAMAKTDRSLNASTTSQQAAPANGNRRRLIIQNQDASTIVFVNLGSPATTGLGSIRIGPGGSLDIEGSTDPLNVIAASGTPAVTVWEF